MRNFLTTVKKLPVVKEVDDIGPVSFVPSHRARRINLTVKVTGEVRVAMPKRASFKEAERFVLSKREWIKRQFSRLEGSQSVVDEYAGRIENLDIDEAAAGIAERLREIAAEFGFSYNRLTIRNQKTRWGSCSMKNNLSLNIKLALLPDELKDFILVHELAHTEIKNHGPDFWQKLESIYPNARELDKQINRLGALLRIPLSQ